MSTETTAVDLNLLMKIAVTIAHNFIVRSTRNFSVVYAKNIPLIKGNFQQLEQVVVNLLQNSCQALPNKEKGIFITTSYNADKQSVEIRIRDEGIGIPPEKLSQIKDPFFTTKRNSGGTGLGLSISSTIVKDHLGTLSFSSELGKGTTALINLPTGDGNSRAGNVS